MENIKNLKKVNPVSITQKIKLLEEEILSDGYTDKEKNCLKREINALKLERMSKNVRPYLFVLKLAFTLSIVLLIISGIFFAKKTANAAQNAQLKTEYEFYLTEAYEYIDNTYGDTISEEKKVQAVENYMKKLNPAFEKLMN